MKAKADIRSLLKNLSPRVNAGEYVFCSISTNYKLKNIEVVASILESDSRTIVIRKEDAEEVKLHYDTSMSWITLDVVSSLEAIGLTSTISKKIADHKISCNIIAGYYHDHIFVPYSDHAKAIQLLKSLSSSYI